MMQARVPASPAHACLVVMAARRLGKALVGVQLSEQAPRGCSSGVRASPCQGEGPGFKSWQPLAIDYGAVDQLAGVTPFRSADVRVRIPVALRSEAGRPRPHRSARTGRACPRPPLHGALAQRLQHCPAKADTFGCAGSSPARSSMEDERAGGADFAWKASGRRKVQAAN